MNTLMAERKTFNAQKLFRWLLIEDIQPKIITAILEANSMEASEIFLRDSEGNEAFVEFIHLLLNGDESLDHLKGPLTLEELQDVMG